MTRTYTFKSVLVALLLACCAQFAFTQTFWTETFSNQASSTTNWVHDGTNAGPEVWKWTDVLNAGSWNPGNFTSPTGSTGYMWFDSDANGENAPHDVTLTGVGVPANCTGKSNVHLKFYTYFRTFSGTDVARVGVSTDGTNFTYINVQQFDDLPPEGATASVYQGSIDIPLPQADNQAQVWIQFRWQGDYEYYWKVDDIELYEAVGPVPCDQNPMAIICDNFETYTIGNISPQAAHWIPWDLNDNSPVSAEVSTEFASQGTKSMKVKLDGAGDDQLLKLGNKATGRYSLKWKQYVPTGKAAYINVQTDENAPGAASANFSFQCYFNANGTTTIDIPTPAVAGTYPQNQWFTVEFVMDLDNNLAKFFINGGLARAWTYTQTFGAIDFYAADASYIFYVDEVEYVNLPAITYNVDECGGAIDLSLYFGSSPGTPVTTGIYDNTTATVSPTDPAAPSCWFDGIPTVVPKIDGSMWYTFTGDGNTYHIETVPCNSTNYIDNGDTQMAIYTGECGNLTQVPGLCNEDLTGAVDFRSALDIETVSGTNYYMLIDGWSDAAGIAQGEFCIEITQKPSITCDDGAVGTYTVANNGFVCNATTTGSLFDLDEMSFVLPTIGPVYGVCWAISTEPVTPGSWPPDLDSYWGSFAVSPNLYVPNLNNNGNPLQQNAIWYFTPVVVAGAVDTIPQNAAFLHQLNIDDACYFVGESTPLILLAELAPLDATAVVTPASGGNNNGAIALTVTGGIFDILQDPASSYTVSWTGPNGFTSNNEDLTGLAPGTYSCTITDVTGCADPYDFTVDVLTSVKDPASVKSLTLTPNPTADFTTLNLTLANAADVRIEVVNTLGQTLQTLDAGKVNTLSQRVDLSRFADGTYFLRLIIDGETAIRRVVVQR
jgi:hypothetical protein